MWWITSFICTNSLGRSKTNSIVHSSTEMLPYLGHIFGSNGQSGHPSRSITLDIIHCWICPLNCSGGNWWKEEESIALRSMSQNNLPLIQNDIHWINNFGNGWPFSHISHSCAVFDDEWPSSDPARGRRMLDKLLLCSWSATSPSSCSC